MNRIVENYKSRLSQLEKEIRETIIDYLGKNSVIGHTFPVQNLIINNHDIEIISFNNLWHKIDISLYYNYENFGEISLTDVSNINDLLNICQALDIH